MRLVSREQALKIDELSQKQFGRCGCDLMEEAGHKMAEQIVSELGSKLKRGVIVVAGPGNNGGDALVIARHIFEHGYPVRVFLPKGDKGLQVKIQEQKNCDCKLLCLSFNDLSKAKGYCVVDGIFGVGLTRNISGDYFKAVEWINAFKGPVYSVDVPTGLNSNTGSIMGAAVRATATLTVKPPKLGLYLRNGPDLCGRIKNIEIDFPIELVRSIARDFYLMELRHAKLWFPKRVGSGNKANFGKAFIVAGSEGKWGAAVLSVRAAFRAGAGYVVHSSLVPGNIIREVPEAMVSDLSHLKTEILKQKKCAVAIGPGAGVSDKLLELIEEILETKLPMVLDADALTVLAANPIKLRANVILTPHAGELARLLGWSSQKIESDPMSAALAAHKKFGCTVVLKGLFTIVVSGYSGRCVIIPRGNVALAKAGTGDVLTGLIVGFLAQGLHPIKAVCLSVFIHGTTAENWTKKNSANSFSASDLLDDLPKTMRSLEA